MAEPLRFVAPETVVTGYDFSTGAVKCLAFDLSGETLAEVRQPTDLWTAGGVEPAATRRSGAGGDAGDGGTAA